jgi:hypothetical protein
LGGPVCRLALTDQPPHHARRHHREAWISAGGHRFVDSDSGGDAHRQVGNIVAMADRSYDWLESAVLTAR